MACCLDRGGSVAWWPTKYTWYFEISWKWKVVELFKLILFNLLRKNYFYILLKGSLHLTAFTALYFVCKSPFNKLQKYLEPCETPLIRTPGFGGETVGDGCFHHLKTRNNQKLGTIDILKKFRIYLSNHFYTLFWKKKYGSQFLIIPNFKMRKTSISDEFATSKPGVR